MSEMKTITINGVTYTIADPDSATMGPNGNWWVDGKDTGIPIVNGAGKNIPGGGVVFGYEFNEAPGVASISAGDAAIRVGGEYAENAAGKVYVASADCELAKRDDVIRIGYEVISLDRLNNGTDAYVLTSTGGYCLREDARFNEAVGSGSTANGLGAISFARASKSLGYRTQTGCPPTLESARKRPELKGNHLLIPDIDFEVLGALPIADFNVFGLRQITLYYDGSREVVFSGTIDVKIWAYAYNSANSIIETSSFTMLEGSGNQHTIALPSGTTRLYLQGQTTVTGSPGYAAFHMRNAALWSPTKESDGQGAVATGADTAALANHDYAGGLRTLVKGPSAFGHGRDLVVTGEGAFGAGVGGQALEYGAFTSGDQNKSRMYNAFTCGAKNEADNSNALVGGTQNRSGIGNQAVFGKFNVKRTDAMLVVGNGTSTSRNNALVVKTTGEVLADGAFTPNGADYAEFFEWQDGNPKAEDRIGLVVALDGEKIRPAMPGDDVLGIVSGTAAVLGDSAAMYWKDKYLTDEYGRVLYDMVEEFMDHTDSKTDETVQVSLGIVPQPRLNPAYDPEAIYIPREERKEWDQIGIMGKLYTRDDGTCAAGDYGCPGENGVLTKSETPTNIRVMKRTGDNIVLVLLK